MAVDLGYDEGGSYDVLLVSMQLAVTKKAKRMSKLWKKQLVKNGIPYFHSKDYRNVSSGIFQGLSIHRRKHLLDTLGQYTRLRTEIGLTAILSYKEYESITDPQFRSKWATAYSFAIAILFLGAKLYMDKFNLGNEVNVLIEEGHRNSGQAIDLIKTLKETPKLPGIEPLKVLSYGLGSKKDHPILQAADMLVFGEWENLRDGHGDIYDALHREGIYRPEMIEVIELVPTMRESIANWEAGRKIWGRRRARPVTAS